MGHQRIDCLNTQCEDAVIRERIASWQKFLKKKGLQGVLRSQPTNKPLSGAYEYVAKLLREGHLLATALYCTTGPCAIGAMRALKDAGLEVGRDVSVCAVNDEGIGRFLLKSLTALESQPRSYFLRRVTEWMLSGNKWKGSLLVEPEDAPLFQGETVGPAPADGVCTVVKRL
jgi:DNA-binding LacI/PurR family transcriptional regulator